MRVKNLKVKTPSIPSRTAANQFIDVHGYDMEWAPELAIFFVHDTQKANLHGIHMDEVTNFSLDVEPVDFMKTLRAQLGEIGIQLHGAIAAKTAKSRKKGEPVAA